MPFPRPSFLILSCLFSSAFCAHPDLPAVTTPLPAVNGSLVLVGGGTLPDDVYDSFLKRGGGSEARVIILCTAGTVEETRNAERLRKFWKGRGATTIDLWRAPSRQAAHDPDSCRRLGGATAVWLVDESKTTLAAACQGTAVEIELHKLLGRGAVIGGSPAATALMGEWLVVDGEGIARVARGLGFLRGAVADPNFRKQNRLNRLLDVLAQNPGFFGLGIEERSALVLHGRTLEVMGQGHAVACLAAGNDRPPCCEILKQGDKADVIALQRAARARTRPAHPALSPLVPSVAKGALIIGGGGGLSDEVWRKFIACAGGPQGAIVCIATAMDHPLQGEAGEAKRLRQLSARHVTTLHARSRAEAESPGFIEVLAQARGLWFTGGRQWRLVDAYEGTRAEAAFHDVLARGGVIGGSSAGASIQADYMVRGDPLGNLKIMAEGYERGFGFLKGVAIDQHFLKRKRTLDMSMLMARYPQLLGIGIDEGAALYIHGEIMEIMGKSNVLVYDRNHLHESEKDYEILTPGCRFNLRTRQAVGSP